MFVKRINVWSGRVGSYCSFQGLSLPICRMKELDSMSLVLANLTFLNSVGGGELGGRGGGEERRGTA